MDDFYVYTSSAVDSTSHHNDEQLSQDDPLINAFTNFGWGQRFNKLLDTVKKQSDIIVEVTKNDLQEFASTIRDDTQGLVEQFSQATTLTATIIPSDTATTTTTQNERLLNSPINNNVNLYDSIKEGLGKISTVNFKTFQDGLSDTLTKPDFLPTQLTSIKLPDNINLGELREELDQGTRFAELYLQKFGTQVLQVLNDTISVLEPEQDNELIEQDTAQSGRPRIFASRTEALIAKLQTDDDSLLMDPKVALFDKENEIKNWMLFANEFDVQKHTSEISTLLDDSPELRETMNGLVPLKIDYTTFWTRYFYHVWRINQEEMRRRLLVKDAELDHEYDDFRWDSEDEDLADPQTTHTNISASGKPLSSGTSPTSANKPDISDTRISGQQQCTGTTSTATSQEGQAIHVSGYNVDGNNNDDSDSDWE